MTPRGVTELVMAELTGVWAIRSRSQTVYYVDLDNVLLLRRAGPQSSPGPGDGRWVPLVSVRAVPHGDLGTIRVGHRHEYVYDWEPDGPEYGFWIQRAVTSIDCVEAEKLADLPASPQGESL